MANQQTLDNNALGYDEYTCPLCYKTISPDRPPVFNDDNCSCVESAMVSNGGEGQQSFERTQYRPDSYASSSHSVPSPEGPENKEPNIHLTHTFLPLGPEGGHNEREHRRSSASRQNMSYPMRRFLIDLDMEYDEPAPTRFLQQEVHVEQVQGSMMVNLGSKKSGSKKSLKSERSGGDVSYVGYGSGVLMNGMGGWVGEGDVEGLCVGTGDLEISGQL